MKTSQCQYANAKAWQNNRLSRLWLEVQSSELENDMNRTYVDLMFDRRERKERFLFLLHSGDTANPRFNTSNFIFLGFRSFKV